MNYKRYERHKMNLNYILLSERGQSAKATVGFQLYDIGKYKNYKDNETSSVFYRFGGREEH